MRQIVITMKKEYLETVRNRWLLGFVLTYLVLALAVGVLSRFQSQRLDIDTLARIHISLMNLSLFLVPLIGLLLGAENIVHDFTSGWLELLEIYPITWRQFVVGKFLGLFAALSTGLFIGFGSAGAALALFTESLTLMQFMSLLLLNLAIGASFIGIGLAVSAHSRTRGGALTGAMLTWLFVVLIYDMLLVQVIVSLRAAMSQAVFNLLILINPIDPARLLISHFLKLGVDFGSSTGVLDAVTAPSPSLLVVAGLAWMLLPLVFCRHVRHGA